MLGDDKRLFAVAAWRDNPCFTEGERAAMALCEAVTRLSDRPDPIPDEIWEEAALGTMTNRRSRPLPSPSPTSTFGIDSISQSGRWWVIGRAERCYLLHRKNQQRHQFSQRIGGGHGESRPRHSFRKT